MISIAFGVIALFMALLFPKIADLMVIGLATSVIFVLVTIFALIRQNVLKYWIAALISIITGFLVNLFFFVWGITSPDQFEPKASFIPTMWQLF